MGQEEAQLVVRERPLGRVQQLVPQLLRRRLVERLGNELVRTVQRRAAALVHGAGEHAQKLETASKPASRPRCRRPHYADMRRQPAACLADLASDRAHRIGHRRRTRARPTRAVYLAYSSCSAGRNCSNDTLRFGWRASRYAPQFTHRRQKSVSVSPSSRITFANPSTAPPRCPDAARSSDRSSRPCSRAARPAVAIFAPASLPSMMRCACGLK